MMYCNNSSLHIAIKHTGCHPTPWGNRCIMDVEDYKRKWAFERLWRKKESRLKQENERRVKETATLQPLNTEENKENDEIVTTGGQQGTEGGQQRINKMRTLSVYVAYSHPSKCHQLLQSINLDLSTGVSISNLSIVSLDKQNLAKTTQPATSSRS